jgi:hypothetical protein
MSCTSCPAAPAPAHTGPTKSSSQNAGDLPVATCGPADTFTTGSGKCTADVVTDCGSGTFGVQIGTAKICALCPAGEMSAATPVACSTC